MYDITIIGAGVSGIFAALKLAEGEQHILMIDKGRALQQRICPLDKGGSCECTSCAKYIGFGGLGKSEGKYNYTNDFGGELETKVGYDEALKLMEEVDEILCSYGGDQVPMYSTENPSLMQKANESAFRVLVTKVRHLGTKLSEKVLDRMFETLQQRIEFRFETEVNVIHKQNDTFELTLQNGDVITTRKVIIATGRSGNDWLAEQCRSLNISQNVVRLDLGIRVEMRGNQLDSILQSSFETKLQYIGEDYTATTYCMNPQGRIIRRYQEGLVMADGQNYRERSEGSSNLNFTLFIPRHFTSVGEAGQYANSIIGTINGEGERIVVQRLEDLRQGIATVEAALAANRIHPSLSANCGNLLQEVPELYTDSLLKFVDSLESLLGESVDEDTLLYGMDAKFYAPRIETSDTFETQIGNLFVIGDCSGITHSLSQAAASGIYIGKLLAASTRGDTSKDGVFN